MSGHRTSTRSQLTIYRGEDGEEVHVPCHARTRRSYILMHGRVGEVPGVEQRPAWVIDPLWRSKMLWDSFVFLLIAYQVFIIPMELAFVEDNTFSVPFNAWWIVDFAMGVFFLIDLVLNCMTSFINDDGLIVVDQWDILRNYALKFPFHMLIDMAALLPFFIGFVELSQGDDVHASTDSSAGSVGKVSKTGRFFRYMRLIRIMRLLRLARAMKVIQELERVFIFYGRFMMLTSSFLKIALVVICLIHGMACVWRSLSNFTEHASEFGIDDGDVWASYTFSVSTIVAMFGGSMPQHNGSNAEMWLNSFFLMTAVSLVSIYTAVIVKMFDEFGDERAELNLKLRTAKRFISAHPIDEKLKSKVLGAVRSSFKQQRTSGSFKQQVEPLMSQDLRQQLHGSIHAPVLMCFPPFCDESQQIIDLRSRLAAEAHVQVHAVGSLIFQEGGIENSMVFIVDGQALLHSERYQIEINAVSDKWFFGERCFFRDTEDEKVLRRSASLFALKSCTILDLDSKFFLSAVQELALDSWLAGQQVHAHKIAARRADGADEDGSFDNEGYWGCPACQGKSGDEGHWLHECQILIPWLSDGKSQMPKPLFEVGELAFKAHQTKMRGTSLNFRQYDMVYKHSLGKVDARRSGAESTASAIYASEEIRQLSDCVQQLSSKVDSLIDFQLGSSTQI